MTTSAPSPAWVALGATQAAVHPFDIYAQAASTVLPPGAWDYLMGAAGSGEAARRNELDLQKLQLLPRICRDVSELDTTTHLFGRELQAPVVVAPSAMHRLFHPDAEQATARGAVEAGIPFTVSMEASTAWSDLEFAASSASGLWCQISPQRQTQVTLDLIQRAEAAGAQAVVLTLDTPVSGARYRQWRTMPELPSWLERPNLPGGTTARGAGSFTNPAFTWSDVEQVTTASALPVIGKGILHPQDALAALQSGVSAVAVSNHGGRNLDAAPSTISCLADVVDAVDGQVPVLFDGGVRRGSDVVKALAVGATAVMLARPVLWGLAARGADGVSDVLHILLRELRETMALCGMTELASLDRSFLAGSWPRGEA